jgi:hypothetical protein
MRVHLGLSMGLDDFLMLLFLGICLLVVCTAVVLLRTGKL